MNIGVIGTGYVGLVTGVCLADFGHHLTCMDNNQDKIDALKRGEVPIYEPGIHDLVERNVYYQRLRFTTDIRSLVEENDVIFIAVGTPPREDGSADLQHVLSVARDIGRYLNSYKVIVDKSTVPIGTGRQVQEIIQAELKLRGEELPFDVVSNPEFLREGKAVYDFNHPDRVVVGSDSDKAREMIIDTYRVLHVNQVPFIFTDLETAEMIKYASNAFLAVKISFINELALLADDLGANIQDVARTMGMDGRISPKFLHPGPGYGGSCFPKDTQALVNIASTRGRELKIVEAAIQANDNQKREMVTRIEKTMQGLSGKTLAVLGLSFKPETDDVREAPALSIIRGLIEKNARIRTFCPKGMKEARWRLADIEAGIHYSEDEYDAASQADAVIIVTEWNQFRGMDLQKIKSLMKDDYFFDLRNVYSRDKQIRTLFRYSGVGVR